MFSLPQQRQPGWLVQRDAAPARGRQGGADGAPTTIARSDGMKMRGKGKQFVPHGARVKLAFPGGAGFGDAKDRDPTLVKRDLARGYISADVARRDYGLTPSDIAEVMQAIKTGEAV